ncbi:MAG: cytochrome c oxidase accessory protein CcoG [Magnetococcales bacterium]|nr:cytochrome c oxidase accessory protein CcoG [Magnetococcales bacterium]
MSTDIASDDEKSLYANWKKIYPSHQPGFFRNLRWVVYGIELGIYFLLPLVRWERPEGLPTQAVLFDLPERKFYLFDLIIWPQDIFLLAFLLIAAAIGLFFMTALAGRVFCGFMCIQTVWTDLFLLLERLFEGDRKRRLKFDRSPWSLRKLLIKSGKMLAWLVVSLLTGAAFVFYFADAPTMARQFLDGSAPYPAWFTLGLLTVTTFIMAGFAREQVCIYMCPYARFQGVMFDEDTLIVAYHPELGEPRESNRRKRTAMGAGVGACIDCDTCVVVCPMGIDIRNGQQYECITCAACIDACDVVRRKAGFDVRLIRYTSLREMKGDKIHWLRGRVVVYALLLSLFLGGIVFYLLWHVPLEMTVIGHRQPLYIMQSDGGIQNNYTLRVLNMTASAQQYRLRVAGLAGAELSVAAVAERDERGDPVLRVEPGSVNTFTLYLKQAGREVTPGRLEISFQLMALATEGGAAAYKTVFMRP